MSLKFTDGSEQVILSGPTTGITAVFATNPRLEMKIHNRSQLALLVDYTKGTESSMELLVEFSPDVDYIDTDGNVAQPVAAGTDYYGFSDLAASGAVVVLPFSFTVVGGEKLRIPIPILHQERMLRLSVKRTAGADATAGVIKLRVIDDAHHVTSALVGRQP